MLLSALACQNALQSSTPQGELTAAVSQKAKRHFPEIHKMSTHWVSGACLMHLDRSCHHSSRQSWDPRPGSSPK